MAAHPVGEADRADFEIDGLDRAEGTLDGSQSFISEYGSRGAEPVAGTLVRRT